MALFGRKAPELVAAKSQARVHSLAAAATRIDLSSRKQLELLRKRRQDWQDTAWGFYDNIGEVNYAINFLGNALSKLRLFVAERDDPKAEPIPTENADAEDALQRLASPVSGHSQMLYTLGINLSVAGDCYLVGYEQQSTTEDGRPTGEEPREYWEARSVDEVEAKDDKFTLKEAMTYDGNELQDRVLVPGDDFLMRIWMRHPRKQAAATSSLRAVFNACEELLAIDRAVRAAARSRLFAGLLLLPDEISFGPADKVTDEAEGEDEQDPFTKELLKAMTLAVQDEGDASSLVPITLRMKGDYLQHARKLDLFTELDARFDDRTDRAMKRLAQGLNVPIEVVLGFADVNHWTAWQIEESTFKAHIEPLAVLLVDALSNSYLRAELAARNVQDPDRYVVWYDEVDLVARPNRAQDAKDLHDRQAISDDSLREATGFNEEDAPDEEELRRRIDAKRPIAPTLPGQQPDEGPPEDQPDEPESPDDQNALVAAGRSDVGARLAEIDRVLRTRLEVAADAAMKRALDRVGAQLRSRSSRDKSLRQVADGVDNRFVARQLGPKLVKQLGLSENEAIEGAFDNLRPQFLKWVAAAQQRALKLAAPNLDETRVEQLQQVQEQDRNDAWEWFNGELLRLAHERVYDPAPDAPEQGEFDASLMIPHGVVREAVARAGGQKGVYDSLRAGAMHVDVRPSGIGTGPVTEQALREVGQRVVGFTWVYGEYPRERPFDPHLDLDGVTFENFDDEVLVNDEGWPPTTHYLPGDHDGCRCDFEPIIGIAGGSTAVLEDKIVPTSPDLELQELARERSIAGEPAQTFLPDEELRGVGDVEVPLRVGEDAAELIIEAEQDEMNAIAFYTEDGYMEINSFLQAQTPFDEMPEFVSRNIQALDDVFADLDQFESPVLTFRGIDVGDYASNAADIAAWADQSFPVGASVDMGGGFASTSLSARTAAAFAQESGNPVMFEILASKGAYVDPLSSTPGERELLMHYSTKYKVRRVLHDVKYAHGRGASETTTRMTVVQLEQVV